MASYAVLSLEFQIYISPRSGILILALGSITMASCSPHYCGEGIPSGSHGSYTPQTMLPQQFVAAVRCCFLSFRRLRWYPLSSWFVGKRCTGISCLISLYALCICARWSRFHDACPKAAKTVASQVRGCVGSGQVIVQCSTNTSRAAFRACWSLCWRPRSRMPVCST